jgi:hypothetical protein
LEHRGNTCACPRRGAHAAARREGGRGEREREREREGCMCACESERASERASEWKRDSDIERAREKERENGIEKKRDNASEWVLTYRVSKWEGGERGIERNK